MTFIFLIFAYFEKKIKILFVFSWLLFTLIKQSCFAMQIKFHFKLAIYTDIAEEKKNQKYLNIYNFKTTTPLVWCFVWLSSPIIQFQEHYITDASVLTLKHLEVEECT